MARYTEKTKRKAAELYIRGGLSLSEISEMEGMPSRPVLTRWAQQGEGSDGVPWKEARETWEREMSLARREQTIREADKQLADVIERAKADIQSALETLVARATEGTIKNASYSQIRDLYEFFLKLESRQVYQEIESIMRSFVQDVARVLTRHITDEQVLRLISLDMREVLIKYEEKLRPYMSFK